MSSEKNLTLIFFLLWKNFSWLIDFDEDRPVFVSSEKKLTLKYFLLWKSFEYYWLVLWELNWLRVIEYDLVLGLLNDWWTLVLGYCYEMTTWLWLELCAIKFVLWCESIDCQLKFRCRAVWMGFYKTWVQTFVFDCWRVSLCMMIYDDFKRLAYYCWVVVLIEKWNALGINYSVLIQCR